MQLMNQGRNWRLTDAVLDGKLIQAQYATWSEGLSIWGTSGCDQCGACCYYLEVPEIDKGAFTLCDSIELENGKAVCGLHDEKKPGMCSDWGCYGKTALISPRQRYVFARIAVDILRTKNEQDIMDLIK
jgi:hypothetical protein